MLKVEAFALYLACRDPRVPWYAKAFTACVVGYALSPIDLIPDPIPVLGYLDDLLLVPVGIIIARRLIPQAVLAECRERAQTVIAQGVAVGRTAAMVIVAIWILTAVGVAWLVVRFVGVVR
jgi:uncharacterized membrane protein YkvA (DUF1232 family)